MFSCTRKARSLERYNTQVERIERAKRSGQLTAAEYIRLIQDAENAYGQREDSKLPTNVNVINSN
jgi:hypothetical protein